MQLAHVLADCVHEVCLAETHAAVQEERVVRLARRVGHGAASRVREAARVADHECGEREVRVQARLVGAVLTLRQRSQRGSVVGERLRLVGRRCRSGIDRDDDVAVVPQHAGKRFPDQRHIAFGQPVTCQPGGHSHGERAAVELDEHGIGQPRFVPRPRELETQLLLGDLPHLLRVEKGRGSVGVSIGRGYLIHLRPRRFGIVGTTDHARHTPRTAPMHHHLSTRCSQTWISEGENTAVGSF